MDLTLTDEQELMRETLREFLESKDGIALARRLMDGDESVVDEVWADLAEMDYTAVTVPLDYGGFGEGVMYLSLVAEEAGRVAMPAPYPETMAFCVPLLAEAGSDTQCERVLPAVAEGDRSLSFALYDTGDRELPADVALEVDARDDGYRLDGTKTLVPYGGLVDELVVAARTPGSSGEEGIELFLVAAEDVETEHRESLDQTRPMYDVTLDEVTLGAEHRLEASTAGWTAVRAAIDRYTVARCAMLVGAAERVVDLSIEQGNTREQFGGPIGRFQAVKHRVADMWLAMRTSRSLVYYAAWALSNDEPDASRAVAEANTYCTKQAVQIFGDDIQNQGGTGFTWDHDAHIYLKQAKAWENYLESPITQRERICELKDV
jgi:alkylation response protein AidB-like acyl-CoA dehydrogenase